jgi:hypothetical protein
MPTAPTDRRACPRVDVLVGFPCRLYTSGGARAGVGVLEDVSASGARLLVSSQGPARYLRQLTLVPQAPHPLAGVPLALEVVRRGRLVDGGHEVAGRWVRPLSPRQLRALAGADDPAKGAGLAPALALTAREA